MTKESLATRKPLEQTLAREAVENFFAKLHRGFENKLRLGNKIWEREFELLNLFGEKKESLQQEKGEIVAHPCRSLSLAINGLVIKSSLFTSFEKPKIFLGQKGRKGVMVTSVEDLPYVIPLEIDNVEKNEELTKIKYDIDEAELVMILNFLKQASFPGS